MILKRLKKREKFYFELSKKHTQAVEVEKELWKKLVAF